MEERLCRAVGLSVLLVAACGDAGLVGDPGDPGRSPTGGQALSSENWTDVGRLREGRYSANAVLLGNGEVLLAGGFDASVAPLASAERYDAATRSWRAAGSMAGASVPPILVRLVDGRVLVIDLGFGTGDPWFQLYDPSTEAWSPRSTSTGCDYAAVAALADGRALAVCRATGGPNAVRVFANLSESWIATSSLPASLAYLDLKLLPSGEALVVGTNSTSGTDRLAFLYTPGTETWTRLDWPEIRPGDPPAAILITPLSNGRILLGYGTEGSSIVDPITGQGAFIEPVPTFYGQMPVRPVALPNGRAMVAGGATDEVVILDPDTGRWSYGPRLLRERGYHSTVVLPNGCVLVAGGFADAPHAYDTAEILCAEPAATPAAVTVPEDVPTSIRLAGTSNFGPPSDFRIVTEPVHGTLAGVAPDLVYSPGPDYAGLDEFTFVASMGTDESPPATVTIEVVPLDDPPVAGDLALETAQGQPLSIRLTATDVDSASLTFRIVGPPAAGELLPGTAPEEFLYSPRQDFVGDDAFIYVASDGATESAPARVTVHVRPAPEPERQVPNSGAMASGCGCSGGDGTGLGGLVAVGAALRLRRRGRRSFGPDATC